MLLTFLVFQPLRFILSYATLIYGHISWLGSLGQAVGFSFFGWCGIYLLSLFYFLTSPPLSRLLASAGVLDWAFYECMFCSLSWLEACGSCSVISKYCRDVSRLLVHFIGYVVGLLPWMGPINGCSDADITLLPHMTFLLGNINLFFLAAVMLVASLSGPPRDFVYFNINVPQQARNAVVEMAPYELAMLGTSYRIVLATGIYCPIKTWAPYNSFSSGGIDLFEYRSIGSISSGKGYGQ